MPALTMMRAMLAWWIVAFHAAPLFPFGIDQQTPFLKCGVVRVDCFFVISGFVLFTAHATGLNRKNPTALRNFFVARFARVYPLHLVMLCAFVILVLATQRVGIHLKGASSFTIHALVNQLLLLNGSLFPDTRSWNYPSWSIGAEAMAYIAAPLLFLSISGLSRKFVLPAMLVCGLLVIGLTEMHRMTRPGMLPCRVLLEFGLGGLMSRVVQQFHTRMRRIRLAALLLGLAIAVAAASLPGHGLFFAALLWMIAFLSLRSAPHAGLPGRIEAVWLYLGETSFAVYICHAFVLVLWSCTMTRRFDFGLSSHRLLAAILLCAAIQLMATSLNHLVEVPARRWIRTALSRRSPGVPVGIHPEPFLAGVVVG